MSILSNIAVDTARLRTDIKENAQFGSVDTKDGHARTVLTGTAADETVRDRFVDRLEEAGLTVEIDSVGNIVGTWVPENASPDTPAVVTGSHLDSVPRGGMFDGVLGVYGGLEAIRALQESSVELERPLKVVSFTEEEGARFADSTLGSSVVAKDRTSEEALALTDANGTSLQSALEEIGYHGTATFDASEWDSWVELHIEQGKRLAEANASAGVVTSISGYLPCYVEITGAANHAGATPMRERADALAAASEFILDVESAATELSEGNSTTVGTVGELTISPDVSNVIPGQTELSVDIRDVKEDVMLQLESRMKASLALLESQRGVTTALERSSFVPPTELDESVQSVIRDTTEEMSINAIELHSGAFHDTRHIAKRTEAGMIFAPSEDGISHSPEEWTDWDDCARAVDVLARTLGKLAA